MQLYFSNPLVLKIYIRNETQKTENSFRYFRSIVTIQRRIQMGSDAVSLFFDLFPSIQGSLSNIEIILFRGYVESTLLCRCET